MLVMVGTKSLCEQDGREGSHVDSGKGPRSAVMVLQIDGPGKIYLAIGIPEIAGPHKPDLLPLIQSGRRPLGPLGPGETALLGPLLGCTGNNKQRRFILKDAQLRCRLEVATWPRKVKRLVPKVEQGRRGRNGRESASSG